MRFYLLRVVESHDCLYEVSAESEDEAISIYMEGVTKVIGYVKPDDPDTMFDAPGEGLVPIKEMLLEETAKRLVLLDEEVKTNHVRVDRK